MNIVNMLVRMIMRRLLNKGMNAGFNSMVHRGKPGGQMTPDDRAQAGQGRQAAKRARQTASVIRRLK